jgi:hypothetical protein
MNDFARFVQMGVVVTSLTERRNGEIEQGNVAEIDSSRSQIVFLMVMVIEAL